MLRNQQGLHAHRAHDRGRHHRHPGGDRDPELHRDAGPREGRLDEGEHAHAPAGVRGLRREEQRRVRRRAASLVLPANFANPFTGTAIEDRAVFARAPTATSGITSYADSVQNNYNIKGYGKSAPCRWS
jgi:hypothetical protein